jgi:hypothetical protein
MSSRSTACDQQLAQATEVARAIAGSAVEVSYLVRGGRNSRVWHVRSGERAFALKCYPSREEDPRDRLATEVGALRLMERCGIDVVPRVVGVDCERGYALLTWIDGKDVADVCDADVDAACTFLSAVHDLRTASSAAEQPLAAEACLCGDQIERQIEGRLIRLRSDAGGERELIDFLDYSFANELIRASRRAHMVAADLVFTAELPQKWRSLIPSDFGFHNAMRRDDGSLTFVDFEYFGWDDPVKLTADILLHPGTPLQLRHRQQFRREAERRYKDDPAFSRRLSAYLPLFGLRWVLILLNEFIPERWRRRVFAGESGDWTEVKARQLDLARMFLRSMQERLDE